MRYLETFASDAVNMIRLLLCFAFMLAVVLAWVASVIGTVGALIDVVTLSEPLYGGIGAIVCFAVAVLLFRLIGFSFVLLDDAFDTAVGD